MVTSSGPRVTGVALLGPDGAGETAPAGMMPGPTHLGAGTVSGPGTQTIDFKYL
jgi:hypothetical protein